MCRPAHGIASVRSNDFVYQLTVLVEYHQLLVIECGATPVKVYVDVSTRTMRARGPSNSKFEHTWLTQLQYCSLLRRRMLLQSFSLIYYVLKQLTFHCIILCSQLWHAIISLGERSYFTVLNWTVVKRSKICKFTGNFHGCPITSSYIFGVILTVFHRGGGLSTMV